MLFDDYHRPLIFNVSAFAVVTLHARNTHELPGTSSGSWGTFSLTLRRELDGYVGATDGADSGGRWSEEQEGRDSRARSARPAADSETTDGKIVTGQLPTCKIFTQNWRRAPLCNLRDSTPAREPSSVGISIVREIFTCSVIVIFPRWHAEI